MWSRFTEGWKGVATISSWNAESRRAVVARELIAALRLG